mmetsp:Transcript_12656/g.24010  ORF Transcript_12656/g.24010 Transcript_12656/m.24010 type:complete len:116 (+) Transcript_12656:314-661(+)
MEHVDAIEQAYERVLISLKVLWRNVSNGGDTIREREERLRALQNVSLTLRSYKVVSGKVLSSLEHSLEQLFISRPEVSAPCDGIDANQATVKLNSLAEQAATDFDILQEQYAHQR